MFSLLEDNLPDSHHIIMCYNIFYYRTLSFDWLRWPLRWWLLAFWYAMLPVHCKKITQTLFPSVLWPNILLLRDVFR